MIPKAVSSRNRLMLRTVFVKLSCLNYCFAALVFLWACHIKMAAHGDLKKLAIAFPSRCKQRPNGRTGMGFEIIINNHIFHH
jgi:hypothetical protein